MDVAVKMTMGRIELVFLMKFINDILTSLGSKISLAVTFETIGILKLLSFKSKIDPSNSVTAGAISEQ